MAVMGSRAKVLVTLSYDGTRYHGFQVQQNALSVCEVLQNALEQLYGTRPPVKGCSRTDAGVHATGYCVSYEQPKPIDPFKLPLALNRFLPPDVRAHHARWVDDEFHARYSSISKEYRYRVRASAVDSPFDSAYCWRIARKLDVEAMHRAAQYVVGTHDFCAFMSTGSKVEDTVRTVFFFRVKQEGEIITFHISADGYLYNMVRILVGTLIDVGAGRKRPEEMKQVLEGKDRSKAGDTAPAKGLFLHCVHYPEE